MPSELPFIQKLLRENPAADPEHINRLRMELAEQRLLPGEAGTLRRIMDRELSGLRDYHTHGFYAGGQNWSAR